MKKILVCEDEAAIRDFVVINLTRAGYDVVEADCGEAALQKYEENNGDFDVAILDVMMPGIDGFQVCKELRNRNGGIGIIMLSAKTQEMDKVTGLMYGADDYVTKPFVAKELIARIRAVTRRKSETESPNLAFENITLNRSTCELSSDKASIRLANKEYQMLEMFMSNPRQIISPDRFMEKIWGFDSDTEQNVVWVYISYLRKKLAKVGANVQIKAARNIGYSLEAKND